MVVVVVLVVVRREVTMLFLILFFFLHLLRVHLRKSLRFHNVTSYIDNTVVQLYTLLSVR